MFQHIIKERGAALVTVLLFVVLIFILISAMLAVSGNEAVIASLQRDSVQAEDLAQAGIQEGMRRVMYGRYAAQFTSAVPCPATATWCGAGWPGVTVTVTRVYIGTNAGFLQIDATATAGRATRHLTALVLQQVIAFPPNITFAASVASNGAATIACGDVYSASFIQFKNYPTNSNCPSSPLPISYAGWQMSKSPGVAACYTHASCVTNNPGNNDVARWWPATRVTAAASSTVGQAIQTFKNLTDPTKPTCAGAGPQYNTKMPSGAILQDESNGTNVYIWGYDTDTPTGVQSQLVPSSFPCGLPYEYISSPPPPDPPNTGALKDPSTGTYPTNGVCADGVTLGCRWFKTIIFEQWFQNYWRFDQIQLTPVKRGNGSGTQACVDGICLPGNVQPDLIAYPQFGAVPPFPDTSTVMSSYDCMLYSASGGTLNSFPQTGTKPDGSSCTMNNLGTASNPGIFVLACASGGSWTINGNITGYGTLVMNCNSVVNGTFTYNGTIIVNGQLQAGTGTVVVNGGLVAQSTLQLIGNITVNGGGTVTSVPTGTSNVFGKAWWER
ncbi:MAG TPA: polymer-forming cytoskeletal protein [bacterium]|nr:polymer-forming cytoskeletal protein [bacterium]